MEKSDWLKRLTNLESHSLCPHFNYQSIFQCGYALYAVLTGVWMR